MRRQRPDYQSSALRLRPRRIRQAERAALGYAAGVVQSYNDQLPQRFVDEHKAIIAAVATRDGDEADRLARAHGEQAVDQVQMLLAGGKRLDLAL